MGRLSWKPTRSGAATYLRRFVVQPQPPPQPPPQLQPPSDLGDVSSGMTFCPECQCFMISAIAGSLDPSATYRQQNWKKSTIVEKSWLKR